MCNQNGGAPKSGGGQVGWGGPQQQGQFKNTTPGAQNPYSPSNSFKPTTGTTPMSNWGGNQTPYRAGNTPESWSSGNQQTQQPNNYSGNLFEFGGGGYNKFQEQQRPPGYAEQPPAMQTQNFQQQAPAATPAVAQAFNPQSSPQGTPTLPPPITPAAYAAPAAPQAFEPQSRPTGYVGVRDCFLLQRGAACAYTALAPSPALVAVRVPWAPTAGSL